MWANVLDTISGLVPVVIQSFLVYLFLILFISLFSSRQMAEMSVGELLIIALLGSSVETSLIAGNKSLLAGLVSMVTLLLSNRLFSALIKRPSRLYRFIIGKPVPLYSRGQVLFRNLNKVGLSEDDLLEGIRFRGYERLDQVRLIVLEIDGSLSVIPEDAKPEDQQSS